MTRKMTTGFYRPTENFNSITEHVAVMFEDNQCLVALVGASDDDPDNLAETNFLAELFASAPELKANNAALTARVKELEEALQKIANNPDCNISGSDYRIGVADGHRCQAEIARAALRGEA